MANQCLYLTAAELDALIAQGWIVVSGPYESESECESECNPVVPPGDESFSVDTPELPSEFEATTDETTIATWDVSELPEGATLVAVQLEFSAEPVGPLAMLIEHGSSFVPLFIALNEEVGDALCVGMNVLLRDAEPLSIQEACIDEEVIEGDYAPWDLLSNMDEADMNGTWSLIVATDAGSVAGTLISATLWFDLP